MANPPEKSKLATLMDVVKMKQDAIQKVAARSIRVESLIRVAGAAMSRNPVLLQCTPNSVVLALMNCAQLGLEPNLLGAAYLVPYRNNKTRQMEAQLIVGYRGLIELARRSQQIHSIEAHVVKEKDDWEIRLGLTPVLEHTPYLGEGEAGKIVFAYAIAKLKDSSYQVEVMSRGDLDKIRAISKARDSGPWATHTEEMCRKTVVRRLCKYLPLTVELVRALEQDIQAEDGSFDFDMPIEAEVEVEPDEPKTQTDNIKNTLNGQQPGTPNGEQPTWAEPENKENPDMFRDDAKPESRNLEWYRSAVVAAATRIADGWIKGQALIEEIVPPDIPRPLIFPNGDLAPIKLIDLKEIYKALRRREKPAK